MLGETRVPESGDPMTMLDEQDASWRMQVDLSASGIHIMVTNVADHEHRKRQGLVLAHGPHPQGVQTQGLFNKSCSLCCAPHLHQRRPGVWQIAGPCNLSQSHRRLCACDVPALYVLCALAAAHLQHICWALRHLIIQPATRCMFIGGH